MKNFVIITFLILLVQQARATDVHGSNINQGTITLLIHKVEYGDLGSLTFTNQNNIEMEFDCENNSYNRIGKNYLRYRNLYNIDAGDFILDEKSCNYIKKFLKLTFEAISEEFHMEMKLDISSKKVLQVILPPLDPYWDGNLKEKSNTIGLVLKPRIN